MIEPDLPAEIRTGMQQATGAVTTGLKVIVAITIALLLARSVKR